MKQECSSVHRNKRPQYYILYSQVWFARESKVCEEFTLHADIEIWTEAS